ncbi:TetR/AcrR family transcriptional regulator [Methylobacterium sp. 17Sr1-1]|uniref:TetR/AcrR family transcriptional regulator n=1 Tax=Methylobacterium sp. 17Sr1-1 TaxID=2202826 RepID=UPI0013A576D8|nr:TetR/AcrR family transcriptional regulator [Methylobacterium sp. 17Sr1-1]
MDQAPTRPTRARDKIFAVAAERFYRDGIRSVGVEAIVKEAGVTKISLYRSFPSKDDLVLAYLEERSRQFLERWDETFDRYDDPDERLRAIMTYLVERTTQEGYRGCPFINFCAEFADPAHPGRQIARATKTALRERFRHLAGALQARDPGQLADGLLLLVEGAYAISQTHGGGPDGVGHALVQAAEALVAQQRAR